MKNCTITIDVTGLGYTYLLQLDAMISDFIEDGDNQTAIDTLHDWIYEEAPEFIKDARANGDKLAEDLLQDIIDAHEAPAHLPEDQAAPARICQTIDADDAGDVFDRLVAAWRANPANENIDDLLEANGLDTENEPGNLYRAGVFEGLAEAAAWMIYATITPEDDADDIHAITDAVYKAYGVAF